MKKIYFYIIVILLLLFCGCSRSVKPLPPIETAKIGTMEGSVNEYLASQKYPDADIKRFNNYVDASAALLAGKIDYAMMDYATARNFMKYNQELHIMPEKLNAEVTAMALNKSNKELNRKINGVLNKFLSDGTVDEIISHWFPEDGSDYKIVNVPKIDDGPVLKVAVTTSSEPRCFIKDGEITGMNVELMDRIAYKLGMRAQYQDLQFAAMVDSLHSGKSDVIAAMYKTPERAERVDFTAGYFPNPQVLLVKKDRAAGVTNEKN
ncbi:MAG: transporter substrate-binding domain-containing protein [Syntrophomonas sp.]